MVVACSSRVCNGQTRKVHYKNWAKAAGPGFGANATAAACGAPGEFDSCAPEWRMVCLSPTQNRSSESADTEIALQSLGPGPIGLAKVGDTKKGNVVARRTATNKPNISMPPGDDRYEFEEILGEWPRACNSTGVLRLSSNGIGQHATPTGLGLLERKRDQPSIALCPVQGWKTSEAPRPASAG